MSQDTREWTGSKVQWVRPPSLSSSYTLSKHLSPFAYTKANIVLRMRGPEHGFDDVDLTFQA
jgi:hypothetical protein